MNTSDSTMGMELDPGIQQVIAEILDLPAREVSADMRREDTGAWDSMSHLRLVTAVESAFGVRMTMDEIAAIGSPRELQQVIRSHHGQK